jgi:proteasome lid subunit RPN8/RPN11
MLKIGIADYDDLRRHGEETYPRESCGILLGRFSGDERLVQSIVRCTNASPDSPESHYVIAPLQLIRAQRDARNRGLEVVGFYHSHPDHPPHWSPTDLAEAHWIGCSYVITAVENGAATLTASFVLAGKLEEEKKFLAEPLVVDRLNPSQCDV